MQPDKPRLAHEWLKRARKDLIAARHDLDANPALTASSVFHSQQAAEKAIKGYLFWHDIPFRKTHDIRELAGLVKRIDPLLEPLLKNASDLTPYATTFRYPGDDEDPTVEESKNAIALAQTVYDVLVTRLPKVS